MDNKDALGLNKNVWDRENDENLVFFNRLWWIQHSVKDLPRDLPGGQGNYSEPELNNSMNGQCLNCFNVHVYRKESQ